MTGGGRRASIRICPIYDSGDSRSVENAFVRHDAGWYRTVFRVLGRNKSLGDYQLYIETNFNGYASRDFHLKKAYAMLKCLDLWEYTSLHLQMIRVRFLLR